MYDENRMATTMTAKILNSMSCAFIYQATDLSASI